mmetsp:Transcript_17532/g.16997  ORF Transcript_17532/g.16997 Transcript_17532/m.16997 type:complete len:83 (-) Transcript_17532:1057-1305(-)
MSTHIYPKHRWFCWFIVDCKILTQTKLLPQEVYDKPIETRKRIFRALPPPPLSQCIIYLARMLKIKSYTAVFATSGLFSDTC